MNTKSRVAGAFIGLAVGDALGVPLERMEKGYERVIYARQRSHENRWLSYAR